jgi:hypothetical protein
MPDYEIRSASDPNKVWPIGTNIPGAESALYLFNHIDAKIKGIGPFTFDDSSPPTDYYLVERLSVKSREATFALYKASQPELVGQKIS